jgi:hypothetical protein
MEEGRGGLIYHARIAISGTRRNALKEAQRATHAIDFVQSSDEMHL